MDLPDDEIKLIQDAIVERRVMVAKRMKLRKEVAELTKSILQLGNTQLAIKMDCRKSAVEHIQKSMDNGVRHINKNAGAHARASG